MSAATNPLKHILDPKGWQLLNSLPPFTEEEALVVGEKLRAKGLPADLVSALMTQISLRLRGAEKFGNFAAAMVFTPDGLEQSTRLDVAAWHADRYREAGCTKVADLGCGIGADSMALAGLGIPVLAVDKSEEAAAAATMNLRFFPNCEVRCADISTIDLTKEGVDGVFLDPARRTGTKNGSRRIKDPQQWSPPLSYALALREEIPALGIKVGPGINYQDIPPTAHAQWVSYGNTVLEAGLWFGPLAPTGPGRSALVITPSPDGPATTHILNDRSNTAPNAPAQNAPVTPLSQWIFEPCGAAIRAGLVAQLATDLKAGIVSEKIAYLTGPTQAPKKLKPFVHEFKVAQVLPLQVKKLSAALRELGIAKLEIRKRGVDIIPDQLRTKLHLPAKGRSAVLILTRLEGRRKAILCDVKD